MGGGHPSSTWAASKSSLAVVGVACGIRASVRGKWHEVAERRMPNAVQRSALEASDAEVAVVYRCEKLLPFGVGQYRVCVSSGVKGIVTKAVAGDKGAGLV
jgi:hypothetical protein